MLGPFYFTTKEKLSLVLFDPGLLDKLLNLQIN
jgi:hypothetical protein